jgi:hypothetical protein
VFEEFTMKAVLVTFLCVTAALGKSNPIIPILSTTIHFHNKLFYQFMISFGSFNFFLFHQAVNFRRSDSKKENTSTKFSQLFYPIYFDPLILSTIADKSYLLNQSSTTKQTILFSSQGLRSDGTRMGLRGSPRGRSHLLVVATNKR